MTHVLVVDDDPQILRAIDINLRARGYDVKCARDGREALVMASRRPPDLVILDLGLPDMDGTDVMPGATWLDHGADHDPVRARR